MPSYDQPISEDNVARLVHHLDCIDDQHDEMLKLVIELCDINSGTLNLDGIQEVAEILKREYSSLGVPIDEIKIDRLKDVDDNGAPTEVQLGQLLHLIKRPEVRPRVLLCIHMDTVYGREHPFQKCVLNQSGVLNGPGVADAKGGLVVMLNALRAFESSPFANEIGWEVIINPDEELGSPGSANFLKQRAKEADLGLLFEPSLPDGALVSARKGVGNFAFVVRGKSVHSGREFENGRNAVVKCCQIMQQVHELNKSSNITFNVGRMNGGAALNVVPDIAIGRINVRVDTVKNMNLVEEQLKQIARQHDGKDGFGVEMFGSFSSPPKELTPQLKQLKSRIEICGKAIDRHVHWRDTGGASDGNKFAAVGLPNVDTLGPMGGNIHSSDEYLDTSTLVGSTKLAALIMLSIAAK